MECFVIYGERTEENGKISFKIKKEFLIKIEDKKKLNILVQTNTCAREKKIYIPKDV